MGFHKKLNFRVNNEAKVNESVNHFQLLLGWLRSFTGKQPFSIG
jgi:hypothetical protein